MTVKHFKFLSLVLVLLLLAIRPAAADVLPEIKFYDKSDQAVTLADFKGQVLLVNIWATWCAPCVAEMPALDRLQAKFPADRFRVVALSLDITSMSDIKQFLARHGIKNLPPYWDKDRQAVLKWPYKGLPTSYLIDSNGKLVKRYDGGFEWDTDETLLKEIGALLP